MDGNNRPHRTRDVERFLRQNDISGVQLVKGPGWFCFEGEPTAGWTNHTVQVSFLADLTLDGWLDAFRSLQRSPH